jgi:hypothetical protein
MALKITIAISGSGVSRSTFRLATALLAELYVLAILKRHCRYDLVLEVGDPQTYALLHCSVFKERTPGDKDIRARII